MPFILRDVGDAFLFPFFESISLMVFHVFLISDLYISKVNAKYCCLAAYMLVLNILLNVLRLIFNVLECPAYFQSMLIAMQYAC